MNELKQCPHCGGNAYLRAVYSYRGNYFIFAKCDICGAQGKAYPSEELPEDWDNDSCDAAVAAWNMRTPEAVLGA